MDNERGFLYLNRANTWPDFDLHGLVILADGALSLTSSGDAVYAERGVFRGGPVEAAVSVRSTPWRRLRADAELPDDTHLQLFTFAAGADFLGDPPFNPTAAEPFAAADGWRPAPRDALDAWVFHPPAQRLWVGGVVRGDGHGSPRLRQLRIDYGHDGYLQLLPAIYRNDPAAAELLDRLLTLDQSVLGGLDDAIDRLPRLFDPHAAPADDFPSWLSWLAGWQGFDLAEVWGAAQRRENIAQAFELHGQRGTVAGLRRYLKLYAGVEAHIEEPALHTQLWSLGEASTLGFTTMLAPAHLQGAVVDASATLDQSHLSRDSSLGGALFDDLAHHFCVRVYCAELTRSGALDDARAVLEREKPAHTSYELCLIEPQLRVGSQARIGIDAIVGQGPPAAQLDVTLNTRVLAAAAQPCMPDEETRDVEP